MTFRLRFAPSPTGKLHVGNIRTALVNWFFCKKFEGEFMLRLDDTDAERSTEEYAQQIQDDMKWLGLDWDLFIKQSDRMDRYQIAEEALKEAGRLYACYETKEELDLKRKIQLSKGQPPIYDRESLSLTEEQIAQYEAEGRKPHWRFKLNPTEIKWKDLVRGDVSFQGELLSDPVLVREDGTPLFTLTTVIDDAETKISHIFRGEDHVPNTAIQIQIFEALGIDTPEFGHFPLITDKGGKSLSKRLGSLNAEQLKADNIEPVALISYLIHLGTNISDDGQSDIEELIKQFSVESYGRATPKFDSDELKRVNEKRLHHLSFEDIEKHLQGYDVSERDNLKKLWGLIHANVNNFEEFKEWYHICFDDMEFLDFTEEDIQFLQNASQHLPAEPWDETSWSEWISNIKENSDRKGKQLFMPLRMALTGKPSGPELKDLLPLLNKKQVLKRLAA